MGVALENARLFDETQRLLKETEQRAAELAVINSIQEGMAAELDFQAIVDLVGDKLREVFDTGDIGIRWYDSKADMSWRLTTTSMACGCEWPPAKPKPDSPWWRLASRASRSSSTTLRSTQRWACSPFPAPTPSTLGAARADPGRRSRLGSIILENFEGKCVRRSRGAAATTVAASMGVALENARLFDETQRLLKETEQRAAELAVINSIQEGMAAELDFQAIIDLVGDKLREVLRHRRHRHRLVRRRRPTDASAVHVRAR